MSARRQPQSNLDPNTHHLAKTITCHAWNGDRTKLALCPNDNTVEIWNWNGSTWSKETVLNEHDQLVTGIDWAPQTNRLVTCSEDRNAYVWTLTNGHWKPVLVILRINRAATNVQWSPKEDKFAVASGAKVVSVCYFEEDNDWWVSKHIKKHKSTVLCVDWHPNNGLLLTASSDFKARIFSAYVKGVDKKPKQPVMTLTAKQLSFGECLMELNTSQGWVHCARFSPSGNQVAFVGHDSTISFCDVTHPENQPIRLKHNGLPFQTCMWVTEYSVIAAGHQYAPFLFQVQDDGSWKMVKKLDQKVERKQKQQSATRGAFAMFQNKVNVGQNTRTGEKHDTRHQNCITYMAVAKGQRGGDVETFTTSGVDGLLSFWHINQLKQQLSVEF